MIAMLVPLQGGFYDPTIDEFGVPVPLFDDMAFLINGDAHPHDCHNPRVYCPRREVQIRTITGDGGIAS